jgi:hypothetical protein
MDQTQTTIAKAYSPRVIRELVSTLSIASTLATVSMPSTPSMLPLPTVVFPRLGEVWEATEKRWTKQCQNGRISCH